MNKVNIQLWIGNNFSSEEEYLKYFQQNENANPLDPEYVEECQFLADVGDIWFNTEYMIIPKRFSSPQDIQIIINSIKVDEEEKDKILHNCKKLGVMTANAVFWYVNADLDIELEVQKPYKENYNELKYIGNFYASSKYEEITLTAESTEQHLWIGTNLTSTKEYDKYFKLDYIAGSIDAPDYKVCGFCQDIGTRWYDEDFIGYPKPLKKEITVQKLIDKLLGPQFPCEQEILKRCNDLDIETANALFWYDASLVEIKKPYKDNYNGLKYIGKFKF